MATQAPDPRGETSTREALDDRPCDAGEWCDGAGRVLSRSATRGDTGCARTMPAATSPQRRRLSAHPPATSSLPDQLERVRGSEYRRWTASCVGRAEKWCRGRRLRHVPVGSSHIVRTNRLAVACRPMNALRVLAAIVGGAVFGGFTGAAIHVYATTRGGTGVVPLAVLAGAGLGLMLSSFTPRESRSDR